VSQTISYEVRIFLIFLSVVFFVGRYLFLDLSLFQYFLNFFFLYLPLFFCWFVSMLAETNRTPFDFSEGESELISGFNVEYRRGGFTILFMSEYARIIFIGYVVVLIFLGGLIFNFFLYRLFGALVVFFCLSSWVLTSLSL